MQALEKTLKYYELLMTYEDTSKHESYDLPEGFHFEFYKNRDEFEWANIHISSYTNSTNKKKSLNNAHLDIERDTC